MTINKNPVKSLVETIARSNAFVVMADRTYMQALPIPYSDVSIHAKIARKLNKPVILIIDSELSHEGKIFIERYFSGYNVIKAIECDLGDDKQWDVIKKEIDKLTRDIVNGKVLSRTDFFRIDLDPVHYYYSFRSEDFEICLEPCAGGFDVAAYNGKKNMYEPRKCTDHDGYLDSPEAMFWERREDTWNKALVMANDLYTRIYIPDCKKNPTRFIGF